ncbi:hypothetical protein SAMN02910368_01856 [Lachnospiraceae bacterium G11]|nr:hypothetical protein SAMN02910368_01856 [Lachnospiraceae bacterium G11]
MNLKTTVKTTAKYLFYILTAVQVILGLIWVINNFTHVYMWPETVEYLDISKNFVIDEYTGLFYPILVKFLYYIPLYILQFLMAVVSAYLLLRKGIKLERINAIFGCAYIVSFPVLLQFHFSIRPESLRLSVVLLAITFLTYKKRSIKRYIIVALLFAVLIVSSKAFQEPGSRGRIQRTFWSQAFMRVCTEYYSQSFVAWDDRTLDTYEIEEALEIIKKTDNMMYEIGPTMDTKWGFEAANESYKFMTKKCFSMRTKDVCLNIGSDLGQSIILPFGFLTELNGNARAQTGRNYEAFVSRRGSLDGFYWYYGVWSLVAILVAGIIVALIDAKNFKFKNPSFELLAAEVIQWLYKTLTTGDAIDYSKYLVVVVGWIVLSIHVLDMGTNSNNE